MKKMVKQVENVYFFNCPHCDGEIMTHTDETRCCIFRHGVLKQTGEQINPHTSEEECVRLFQNG